MLLPNIAVMVGTRPKTVTVRPVRAAVDEVQGISALSLSESRLKMCGEAFCLAVLID